MNHIVYIRFPAGCNINVIFMQHIHNTLVIPLQRNQFYNPQIMNELTEIYKRIEYLRNNGVKMKEIADRVDMAPSVLSALDRKSTRLNSSHKVQSRMPSSA